MPPVAFRDYYETLGVPRDASSEDIRRAYRTLARQYHPDVNKDDGAEDRFKEISEAYEVLRDSEKRERYDRLGSQWKAGQDVSGAGGFEGFDPGAFRGFRPGGFRDSNGGGFSDVRIDFGDGDFSDFFDGLFGGRASGWRATGAGAHPRKGADAEARLDLSLEEAARGGRRRISLADGRDYEVNVPVGVTEGQRIRLAGEGDAGSGGGPAGDLFLRVRLAPHARFTVDGRDLYVDLPVAPWEAALGAEVELRTLDGGTEVKVPAGSSSGRRLRLRGQGLPTARGERGDLYASVRIDVPKRLTKQERELFARLADVSKFDPRKVS
jgi:curved DNA-binding protein